jgi:hypothetical protein
LIALSNFLIEINYNHYVAISNSLFQLQCVLGVVGGFYIWKPVFEQHFRERAEKLAAEAAAAKVREIKK